MRHHRKTVDEILKENVPQASAEQVESAGERVLYRLHHTTNPQSFYEEPVEVLVTQRPIWRGRWPVFAGALAVVLAVLVSSLPARKPVSPIAFPIASVEFTGGILHVFRNGQPGTLNVRDTIEADESVRTDFPMGAGLALSDGSQIELRAESELTLERAEDGTRIRLQHGSIIVHAAKQRQGHLYVRTRDITASVVGTVFMVSAEESGSQVGVLEGEVRVRRGDNETSLYSGEQIFSTSFVKERFALETIAWSRHAAELIALLTPLALPTRPVSTPPLPRSQKPAFEVISIRPNVSGYANSSIVPRGNRFLATNVTAKMLVAYAYQPVEGQLLKAQIIGGEGWTETTRFDVQATLEIDGSAPIEQVRAMVQSMLEDRFQIKVRRETRELSVYNLVLVKAGPKLSVDQTPPDSRYRYVSFASEGDDLRALPRGAIQIVESPFRTTLTGTAIPMAMLVSLLQGRSDRIVLDKTGFKGLFDLDLQIAKDSGALAPTDTTIPDLFTAIQQTGLKLEPAKAPLPVVVLDRIEKPTEN